MKKNSIILLLILVLLIVSGCSKSINSTSSNETGELGFVANGEDFTREGFVSKDGWQIKFDHIYVTLSEIKAYQTNPPYDAYSEEDIKGEVEVILEGTKTIDLAKGDENAEPILVGRLEAVPEGHYNALSWKVVKSDEERSKGNVFVFIGTAEKAERQIDFNIKFDKEYKFLAGEYIGDERKGIVEARKGSDLEMTFHFDHLFGDIETSQDDSLNIEAMGFELFASLAENNRIDTNMEDLETKLSIEEFNKLLNIFPGLGHVGEGHCYAEEL